MLERDPRVPEARLQLRFLPRLVASSYEHGVAVGVDVDAFIRFAVEVAGLYYAIGSSQLVLPPLGVFCHTSCRLPIAFSWAAAA